MACTGNGKTFRPEASFNILRRQRAHARKGRCLHSDILDPRRQTGQSV